jgi:hypothetical protein
VELLGVGFEKYVPYFPYFIILSTDIGLEIK